MKTEELAREVIARLKGEGKTLATAESCTGGLLGKLLTDVPGASSVYKGGVISYVNEVKHRLLGVDQQTLDVCTAVSRETAHEMAKGAREVVRSDVSISTTGLAGPDGDGVHQVGTVFVSMAVEGQTYVRELHMGAYRTRSFIRRMAGNHAFDMMRRYLTGLPVKAGTSNNSGVA